MLRCLFQTWSDSENEVAKLFKNLYNEVYAYILSR